uniref:NADH-ubiquinone oxidoreductase chain 6 n=1 Tax=Centruroides limpidus TaxID=6876 RepID=Q5G794_CENLI|nr:NADH dehydrogenase subunit 6 [Centruroides limpidus]AAV53592.1 NADH dehydrogenase subunit 6 [Centruroides limpidus]
MFGVLVLLFVFFFFSTHPLVMGLILVLSTVFVSFHLFFVLGVGWFSYVFFLVFLGGVLVLFIYVASLAANEPASLEPKYVLSFLVFFVFAGSWLFCYQEFFIWRFYLFFPFSLVIIFLGAYLLMALVAVASICKVKEGPLREMV